ncbi:SHOCT domain-containing protein [Streptomyces sp. NBC_00289]|uniref:SHOCT domain-containing protein n=1 Tax=Streptomyces sp. NBC_00289 TaxID=2975703 RepID=UPI00324F25CA
MCGAACRLKPSPDGSGPESPAAGDADSRGKNVGRCETRHTQAEQQALDDCIRTTAGQGAESGNETERLAKLSDIRSGGDITDEEFQRAKEKILH